MKTAVQCTSSCDTDACDINFSQLDSEYPNSGDYWEKMTMVVNSMFQLAAIAKQQCLFPSHVIRFFSQALKDITDKSWNTQKSFYSL